MHTCINVFFAKFNLFMSFDDVEWCGDEGGHTASHRTADECECRFGHGYIVKGFDRFVDAPVDAGKWHVTQKSRCEALIEASEAS